MHPEAAFIDAYALALVAIATGLTWLAGHDTNPQKATMLRAGRTTEPLSTQLSAADWPHSEAPLLHLAIGAVATAAALVLTIAGVMRHHEPVELVIAALLILVIGTRVHATVRARRRVNEVHAVSTAGQPHEAGISHEHH